MHSSIIRRARVINTGAGGLAPSSAAVVAAPTWDPANKGSAITLSGGNLTATQVSNDGTNFSVRSTTAHASGKFYLEFSTAHISSSEVGVGFGTASATVASSGYQVGVTDNNSIGWAGAGGVYYHAGFLATIDQQTAGGILQAAIDIDNQLLWFRNSAGTTGFWNASGAANPATGVGGVSISPALSGALYLMFSGNNINDALTINLGGSAYTFTPPAGFGNW